MWKDERGKVTSTVYYVRYPFWRRYFEKRHRWHAVSNKKYVKCSQIHIYHHGRFWVRSVRIFVKMVSITLQNFRNIKGPTSRWSLTKNVSGHFWLLEINNYTVNKRHLQSHLKPLLWYWYTVSFLFSLYILSMNNYHYSSEKLVIIL